MKLTFLDCLRCPLCLSRLTPIPFTQENGEIEEGLLECEKERHPFPIIRSIPRFVPGILERKQQFTVPNSNKLAQHGVFKINHTDRHVRTTASFGQEWTTYDVQRPIEDLAYFRSKTGTNPESLPGKIVLDAGCGSGRYSRVAGEYGAKVIGLDFSDAVETARKVTSHLENVQIIQADLFQMPFASDTFDLIISIGVLHHTPNTRHALSCLIPLLRPSGEIAIWLYPRWPFPAEIYNNLLRAVTIRLPLSTVHRLAVLSEPIGLWKLRLLKSRNGALRFFGLVLRGATIGVSYHPDREIRICDTFDWFTPPFQWHHRDSEIMSWLVAHGLVDIVNLSLDQTHYQFGYGNGVNFRARRASPLATHDRI